MLFQRINRSDPEKIFVIGYNSSSDSWSNGYVVRWDYSTDVNGVGMEKPAAAGAAGVGCQAIAGVAAETIAAGAYGLVQVWGYHSAVRVSSGTGTAVAVGTALRCARTAWYAFIAMPVTGTAANCYPKGFALAAQTLYTTTATKAFIQCL